MSDSPISMKELNDLVGALAVLETARYDAGWGSDNPALVDNAQATVRIRAERVRGEAALG